MWSSDIARPDSERNRLVTLLAQGPTRGINPPDRAAGDIFDDDPRGLEITGDSDKFKQQPRALASKALAKSTAAGVLTGEATTQDARTLK